MFGLIQRYRNDQQDYNALYLSENEGSYYVIGDFMLWRRMTGWCFSYMDDVDFDPEEELRSFRRTDPRPLWQSKFASSQIRKDSRIKGSEAW